MKFRPATLLLITCVLTACAPSDPPSPATPLAPTTTPQSSRDEAPTLVPETLEPQSDAEAVDDDPFGEQRQRLVDSIQRGGISDPGVIGAMRSVPRHEFVPEGYINMAYNDHPLPIGYGQTISQPFIVALMTESIEPEPDDVVLEIGTGSGYQAAVLAAVVEQVYTVEIIEELATRATDTLAELGYNNVEVHHVDGYFGWEEQAPYDAIVVTAAPDHIPQPLIDQLADGGRMVIPVGPVGGYQELWLVERQGEDIVKTSLGGVIFVPFTRDEDS